MPILALYELLMFPAGSLIQAESQPSMRHGLSADLESCHSEMMAPVTVLAAHGLHVLQAYIFLGAVLSTLKTASMLGRAAGEESQHIDTRSAIARGQS